jgi:peroxiredoxin
MKSRLLHVIAVLLVGTVALTGCSRPSKPAVSKSRAPGSLSALLSDHQGHVLVLLLGRDDCPGTANATAALDKYVSTESERVSVVRLDVPFPKETLRPTSEWKHSFPRYVDKGRKIAGELEFFFYPTLYVFDGQGKQRYVGGCDTKQIAVMTQEILAEKPGATKKIYTLPMASVGQSAPAFSGSTLTGKAVTRASLMGKRGLLMVFARVSCPFSAGEIPQFKDMATRYRDKGVSVVIVNQEETLSKIKPVYEKRCAGVPVIWDRSGDICRSFGVDAVPFFFLLDHDGKVLARRSFTHSAAANSVNALLGLKSATSRYKPTEGG